MSEGLTLNLHTDVAALKADMQTVKQGMTDIRGDVRDLREVLVEERIKLARFAIVVMGGLYALSKVLDPLLGRILG